MVTFASDTWGKDEFDQQSGAWMSGLPWRWSAPACSGWGRRPLPARPRGRARCAFNPKTSAPHRGSKGDSAALRGVQGLVWGSLRLPLICWGQTLSSS